MKSAQPAILALLALTTLGGAALAWHQYGELVELRGAAMNRDERADLQKRVWDLERMNRELQDRLAAARPAVDDAESLLAAATGEDNNRGDREARGGRGGDARGRAAQMQQAAALRELMNKPEVQAMLNVQQKAAIEQRYAALFRTLNLTSEQSDKLKTLLAERGNTRLDVLAAAREQGIDPRENPDAYRKLLTDVQNELNQNIKSVIGESGFAQLQTYEQTMPQRALVNDIQQRLSYSNTPLSPAQADALVQILASTAPQRSNTPGGSPAQNVPMGRGPGGRGFDGGGLAGLVGGPGGLGNIGGMDLARAANVPVTQAALTQAQSVLAPNQFAALQQIHQQQQAQQQLQQLVRDTLNANQPPRAGTNASEPTAGQASGTGSSAAPIRRRPNGGG